MEVSQKRDSKSTARLGESLERERMSFETETRRFIPERPEGKTDRHHDSGGQKNPAARHLFISFQELPECGGIVQPRLLGREDQRICAFAENIAQLVRSGRL